MLPLIAAAVIAAAAGNADRTPLVGAWTLVAAVQVRPDGSTRPLAFVDSPGPATGLLVYTADGSVSVQIVGHPRPATDRATATADPVRAVPLLRSYYAYYGRFEVDAAHHRLVHHVAESLWPAENGTTYARTYTLAGDRLTFDSDPQTIDGERVFNRLAWVRAEP